MVTPIELIQKVVDGMAERGFGRIVNITSMSVYMPILGLDLSSGARAGLTSFLAGIARSVIDRNVTINQILPGKIDTDRIRSTTFTYAADKAGLRLTRRPNGRVRKARYRRRPARHAGGVRQGLRFPVFRPMPVMSPGRTSSSTAALFNSAF